MPELQTAADGEVRSWVAALSALVDQAESLEQLQDTLLGSFGALPTDGLVKVMEAGMALAQLKGMNDVWEGK